MLLALIAGWFCFRRRELGGVKKHREAPKPRAAGPEKPVPHYREKPGLMDQAMNVYWMRSGNVLNENKAIRGGSGKKNLLFVVIALLFGLLIVGIPILYVQLRWGG